MKKIFSLLLAASLLTAATAQRVQVDVTHSFERQTGLNVYKVTESGFVYGIGGSYLFSSYIGETKGKHQELMNTYLGNDGSQWSNAFRTNYNVTSFTEDRGTARVLLGKSFKYTTIYSSVGLAFRSQYWKGTGWDGMPYFTSPEWNFYVYKNISPRIMYGLTVSQLITRDLGMVAGWDNISGVTYGISFNLKHARLFQD